MVSNSVINQQKKVKLYLNIILISIITSFPFFYLNVNVIDIFNSLPDLIRFFIHNFLPPNFSNIRDYMEPAIETILFAIVGTYISAALSFVLGLLMSQLSPDLVIRCLVQALVTFLRNIPVLIWASLLVFVFGIGNIVGLIALSIATIGLLCRMYAESIDEIATSHKLEALHATGGSFMQILFHGLLPEFIPSWINWTLFSFEINIRASAILGTVGAGGLGILIQTNLNLRNFHEALTLIIILVTMVLLIEVAISNIRYRININH